MGFSESKMPKEERIAENAGTLERLRNLDDLHDIVFKFAQFDCRKEEFKAHKNILACYSVTFKSQFCGVMAQQQRRAEGTEIITLTDFTMEAYMVMFRMIYGEQPVLTQCRDFNILFQVYGLALKYMLSVELATDVMKTIDDLGVSPATVVSALETVLDFKDLDGFEELTKDLVQKVVGNITIATVLPALQVAVRFQAEGSFEDVSGHLMNSIVKAFPTLAEATVFFLDNMKDYPEEVEYLMKAISKKKTSI